MVKVLFVCLGNICRSPMAEAVLRHKIEKAGLASQISVDSAGTANYHVGEPPHQGTQEILRKYHISFDGMACRQISVKDFDEFDYIIGMDDSNLKNILKLKSIQKDKVKLLSAFVPDASWTHVPDPWYTGDFDTTYDLVDKGTTAILNYIVQNHTEVNHN